jgi:hypothetical protein
MLAIAPLSSALAQPEQPSEHALKTFEIFKTIVEVDTSKAMGNTPRVARYLADELIAAGFPQEDIGSPQDSRKRISKSCAWVTWRR